MITRTGRHVITITKAYGTIDNKRQRISPGTLTASSHGQETGKTWHFTGPTSYPPARFSTP